MATLIGAVVFGIGYGGATVVFNPRFLRVFGRQGPGMVLVFTAHLVGSFTLSTGAMFADTRMMALMETAPVDGRRMIRGGNVIVVSEGPQGGGAVRFAGGPAYLAGVRARRPRSVKSQASRPSIATALSGPP